MPVIVPSPGVAARIADTLNDKQADFDRLEKSIDDAVGRGAVLRTSLLTAAFSGRLTAPLADVKELETV